METAPDPARRRVLAGSAAALAAAGFGRAAAQTTGAPPTKPATPASAAPAAKPLPAYAAWKDPGAMIVHSANTVETRRSAFGSGVVTPSNQLYIRNNLPPPGDDIVADRDGWQVAIAGVNNPRTLTVGELKTMGLATVAMVLQCSGNGRGYFPDKPSGTPWQVGAAGCVLWTGVPIKVVAEALGGVAGGMKYMTSTGGEKLPEGIDPKSVMVERSVPLEAMEDALLAWEMNDDPIPLAHGGPLRVIVPGYNGVNNVKYVKQLAFTAEQSEANIQKTGYRLSPPGTQGNPSQPSIWAMAPKSWITSPAPESGPAKAGPLQVTGLAFGGLHAVERVEVSTDGGKTWQQARFVGPDLGRYAWRPFVLAVRLEPGTYTLASRATDAKGTVQDEMRIENVSGYINSSWRDHALQVTVA